jgi:hypothetical protein
VEEEEGDVLCGADVGLCEELDVLCMIDAKLCDEVEGVELDDVVVKSAAFHRMDTPKALIPPPAFSPIGITLVPLVIEASPLGRSETITVQGRVEYCGQLVEV